MEKVTYKVDVINAVLQYLDTRPFGDVVNLVVALKAPENEEKPNTNTEAAGN